MCRPGQGDVHVAAGHALPRAQEDVRFEGLALEARMYAEDYFKGFQPRIGAGTLKGKSRQRREIGSRDLVLRPV